MNERAAWLEMITGITLPYHLTLLIKCLVRSHVIQDEGGEAFRQSFHFPGDFTG